MDMMIGATGTQNGQSARNKPDMAKRGKKMEYHGMMPCPSRSMSPKKRKRSK